MPKLIIREKGTDKEWSHEFATETIDIGRSTENSVQLSSGGVSRNHARVLFDGGNFFIIDLKSDNGTCLNGLKLASGEKNILRHNDTISIENFNLTFNSVDQMLNQSFNEITDSDVLEIKLLKKVLTALDKEKVPSIEVLTGTAIGKKALLTDEIQELTIGRDPSAGFKIEEYVVSRKHARLARKWGGFVIEDLGSKNGTFVNNKKVTEEPLHDGDRISLGTIILIYRNPQEVNLKSISREIKVKEAPPIPVEAEEAKTPLLEEEAMEAPPEEEAVSEYPTPTPRKELINLSFFELGMVGLGVLVLLFAVVSLINVLAR